MKLDKMCYSERRQFIVGTAISLAIISIFVVWAQFNTKSLYVSIREDGPIEYLTAVLFGLSGVCFIVFAVRSDFLKKKERGFRYFMTIAWALLMFVFMAEEISWGQRIFNYTTPSQIAKINVQNEANIHNLAFVDTFLGGKYRAFSVMILTTGLLLPLFALTKIGKRAIKRFAFPVCPLGYSLLFVGGYLYGSYYYSILSYDTATEVREFLASLGMFGFAMHGAIFPWALFRIPSPKEEKH